MEVREDETARGKEGESDGKFFHMGPEVQRGAWGRLDSRRGVALCVGLADGGGVLEGSDQGEQLGRRED